jgi:hypothetical protein
VPNLQSECALVTFSVELQSDRFVVFAETSVEKLSRLPNRNGTTSPSHCSSMPSSLRSVGVRH